MTDIEPPHIYDLEAEDWTKPLSGSGLLSSGVEIYYDGASSFRTLAETMVRVGGVWAAHFGGRYDLLLLLPYLPRPIEMVVVGNTILSATFPARKGKLIIRDTYPAFLASLKKIGESVGVPKLDYNRSTLRALSAHDLRRYNMNDCVILHKGMVQMLQAFKTLRMTRKWTAGGAAIEALRILEPQAWQHFIANRIDSRTAVMAKPTAPGGIVDCAYYGRKSGVYVYDIKSSYPARYSQGPMGAGLQAASIKDWNHPQAILLVKWKTKGRIEFAAPALSRFTHSGSGLCEAWLTYPERMNLEPFLDKRMVVTGYKPTVVFNVGAVFASTMFKLKEKAKLPFAKVWANSAHGKFLEDPIKDMWTSKPSEDARHYPGVDLYRSDVDIFGDGLCDPYYQPVMAGLVYGRARADITSIQIAVEKAGGEYLYTDTDSIHCTLPPDRMPVSLSTELGGLALEGGPYDAIYLGPKLYWLGNANETIKTASKGVNIGSLKSGKFENGVYSETVNGEDLRLDVYERVLKTGSAQILKTGVRSFVSGAGKANWSEPINEIRTIKMTWSGRQETTSGRAKFRHFERGTE